MKKITMVLGGKGSVCCDKVVDIFSKILLDLVAVEGVNIYSSKRNSFYSVDIFIWQISCVIKIETNDKKEFDSILNFVDSCEKMMDEQSKNELYNEMCSCYRETHNKDFTQ
jgi:hypothetical protein